MKITLLTLLLVVACGMPEGGDPTTTTTVPASSGDQPIDNGNGDGIPTPRLPVAGNVDGEVWITGADLRIAESYPIQVFLGVEGDKPTPCHEVFWTVEDDGDAVRVEMISQTAPDTICVQVIESFMVTVPLGSWEGEERDVYLNGELVGSFQS